MVSTWSIIKYRLLYKEYDTEGNVKYTIEYQFGKKNGFERWYYSSGQIKSEKKYVNDSIVGDIIRWDRDGNIIY